MSEDKLKPCPFCGTAPRLIHSPDDTALMWVHYFDIGCNNCEYSLFAETKAKAIKLWNTRHNEAN